MDAGDRGRDRAPLSWPGIEQASWPGVLPLSWPDFAPLSWPGVGQVSAPALLVLCIAALLAGMVDAIGGGGGLIQLPILLLFLPGGEAIFSVATNKLAAVVGTAAAAVAWFYDGLAGPGTGSLLVFALVGLVGFGLPHRVGVGGVRQHGD